ncbi:MAG: phenylalanine--tRNA ligase subunit beta, partial [Bacteroidetes bacterium]|nr:phenylalanine--tRNA ligase subunit beta [Bacteroidota bacterium]
LDIDVLREALPERHVYQPIPRHPNVTRDLAVIVPRSVLAEQIIKTVHTAHPRHLRAIRIVDVFTHESLGPDRKSVAFSMSFQAEDRTLKDEDVTASVDAVVAALARDLQAELRS